MQLLEKTVAVPLAPNHQGLTKHIEQALAFRLSDYEVPIRIAITGINEQAYHCEVGWLSAPPLLNRSPEPRGLRRMVKARHPAPSAIQCLLSDGRGRSWKTGPD